MRDITKSNYRDHIETFSTLRPHYEALAYVLRCTFENASRDMGILSIVLARAKSLSSFAEKIIRKRYANPFTQMTDLCGVRVITETSDQAKRICRHIREHFDIDEKNSIDVIERLKVSEFGYRSVHFIVSLREKPDGALDVPDGGLSVLKDHGHATESSIRTLKAEIQVRTLAQHAWASVIHDNLYKNDFKVLKKKWSRDAARIAAILEDADNCFVRLLDDVSEHKSSYGAFGSRKEICKEIGRLSTLIFYNEDKSSVARRIARLWMLLYRFDKAEGVLLTHYDATNGDLLRDLAEARIKSGVSAKVAQGRAALEALLVVNGNDSHALNLLAQSGGWDNGGDALAKAEAAFRLNPTDPAIFRGYLERKIVHDARDDSLPLLYPALDKALELSRGRAALEVGLPWTFHDIGMLELMRGRPYAGLEAFSQALTYDDSMRRVDSLIETLRRLQNSSGRNLTGLDWARRFLLLAQANMERIKARQGVEPASWVQACLNAYGVSFQADIKGPVVIVAGGCDPKVATKVEGYREAIGDVFRGFEGTVICGGTTAGISGMVGDLLGDRPRVRLISYLPNPMPRVINSVQITTHSMYEIRDVAGVDFTPLGPIQGWLDILASGLRPEDVKVLGINGGVLSAAEYMMAAALGASVGLIRDSGREAFRVLDDAFWSRSRHVIPLPNDKETIRLFINPSKPSSDIDPKDLEQLAKDTHERYSKERSRSLTPAEPGLSGWDKLLPHFKQSNIQQATHIESKLARVGLKLRKVEGRPIELYSFDDPAVIEELAELEHARWNFERLMDGWTLGERDPVNKTSPYLVPWNELPDGIKKYDRIAVEGIPKDLAKYGYEVFEP